MTEAERRNTLDRDFRISGVDLQISGLMNSDASNAEIAAAAAAAAAMSVLEASQLINPEICRSYNHDLGYFPFLQ